jgi:dipeptidyl aminopeptidase/acylaminoacyl peptidase
VEDFEKHYDARRYAFENYYEWIKVPVLIQQGTADVWCKVEWQQEVVDKLNVSKKQAELVVYEGNDHNLSKDWKVAVERDLKFFAANFFSN